MIYSPAADGGQQVRLARAMFYGGCAAMPLLWIVSSLFFKDKLRTGDLPTDAKKWVMLSFAAAVVSTVLCVLWVFVFLTSWKRWEWADVMVSIPDEDLTGW